MAYIQVILASYCDVCAREFAVYNVFNRHNELKAKACLSCAQKKLAELKAAENNEGPGWA